jgi:hypothetical protein
LHSYLQLGRDAEAIAPAQQMLRFKGASEQDLASLAEGSPDQGIRKYCEWSLEWFRKQEAAGIPLPAVFVLLHARLGHTELTMEWLEKAYQSRSGFMVYLGVEPRIDLVRDDPRFVDLLRRVEIPAIAGPRS